MTFIPYPPHMKQCLLYPLTSPLGGLPETTQPSNVALDLTGPKFICFCNQFSSIPLDNYSKWHPTDILDPNIIWNLYKFWKQSEKWKDILYFYVQSISFLYSKPCLVLSGFLFQTPYLLSYSWWNCKFVAKLEQGVRPSGRGGKKGVSQQ